MTEADYKERHLPHRMNLLLTFRERFANLNDCQREKCRDLYRCSKDISGIMIRTLLDELGIYLPKGASASIKERKPKLPYVSQLTVHTIQHDQAEACLLEALKFGNRAVAHLEPSDVDHGYNNASDEQRLVQALDYVEEKIIQHVYGGKSEYDRVMLLPGNKMHRTRMNLASL